MTLGTHRIGCAFVVASHAAADVQLRFFCVTSAKGVGPHSTDRMGNQAPLPMTGRAELGAFVAHRAFVIPPLGLQGMIKLVVRRVGCLEKVVPLVTLLAPGDRVTLPAAARLRAGKILMRMCPVNEMICRSELLIRQVAREAFDRGLSSAMTRHTLCHVRQMPARDSILLLHPGVASVTIKILADVLLMREEGAVVRNTQETIRWR